MNTSLTTLAASLITLALLVAPATAASALDTTTVEGDFDCDGVGDLAIGYPTDDLDGAVDAGQVVVLYGGGGTQTIDLDQTVTLWAEHHRQQFVAGAQYGAALAVGGFDVDEGDRCDDLAVGAPGFYQGLGAVEVLYGSPDGLSVGDGPYTLAMAGYWAQAHLGDGFGAALAAGDFDGNQVDDLAVGIPFDGHGESGRVAVLYSDDAGVDVTDSQYWFQGAVDDHGTVAGTPENDDHFGKTLESDDFDDDGIDDLAIHAPGEDDGAGIVNVLYGSQDEGLTTADNAQW
jgi:hypothetical protein